MTWPPRYVHSIQSAIGIDKAALVRLASALKHLPKEVADLVATVTVTGLDLWVMVLLLLLLLPSGGSRHVAQVLAGFGTDEITSTIIVRQLMGRHAADERS